jgi:thiol-disulfide isomerase/thioredoxin
MSRHAWFSLAALGALFSAIPGRAELWQTLHGDKIDGQVVAVHGPLVVVSGKDRSAVLPMEVLDDAAIERVANFLEAGQPETSAWTASTSKIAKSVQSRLQVLQGDKLVPFEPGARVEPDFYLIYFGALWCGPCRSFSPKLVEAYTRLKQNHPNRFEAIFVSSDRSGSEHAKYVREVAMPWPVLKFSAIGRAAPIERWAGRGIPSLVVLTREGDLIFNSYRGDEYIGPQEVLRKFEGLLEASDEKSPTARRARHRLAVLQHIRGAKEGHASVKPYLISLDRSRYQTLTSPTLEAKLKLDERGRVLEASFEPKLPSVIEYELVKDAGEWLFLPTVVDGKPQAKTIHLPLRL